MKGKSLWSKKSDYCLWDPAVNKENEKNYNENYEEMKISVSLMSFLIKICVALT